MLPLRILVLHGGTGWKEIKERAVFEIERCAEEGFGFDSALDAVVEAVRCMEDSGAFNAGKGAVYDLLGNRSLDAGVSFKGKIGAVANVSATRNAILLARYVMDLPPHMISGPQADEIARLLGLPPLPPLDEEKRKKYEEDIRKVLGYIPKELSLDLLSFFKGKEEGSGTVGAVALIDGELAAATSTGGIRLKMPGRVGDSPIYGAGFYSDEVIACSATGIGAKIVKFMPCLKLAEAVRKGRGLKEAGREIVKASKDMLGPSMGLIAVSSKGEVFWGTNYRKMLVSMKVE
ncbi:asparaginase [Ignicoccus pacificus DSM 13166]|uniref:Plant-type L-asparaginase n=1 Tax=Ignicoccus pacificus DSM 13166 TaxID=940294 RepID=A0A977PJ92_9CREN|nr:asparaginase [Ignicoccus pacificus DSM 13166]